MSTFERTLKLRLVSYRVLCALVAAASVDGRERGGDKIDKNDMFFYNVFYASAVVSINLDWTKLPVDWRKGCGFLVRIRS